MIEAELEAAAADLNRIRLKDTLEKSDADRLQDARRHVDVARAIAQAASADERARLARVEEEYRRQVAAEKEKKK